MKKTPVTQEQIGDLPCQNHTKRISTLERQVTWVNKYWSWLLAVGTIISITSAVIVSGYRYDNSVAKKSDIQELSKQIQYLNIRFSAYKTEDSIIRTQLIHKVDSLTKIYLAKR